MPAHTHVANQVIDVIDLAGSSSVWPRTGSTAHVYQALCTPSLGASKWHKEQPVSSAPDYL